MTARDFLATPTAEVTASAAPASETGRLRPKADGGEFVAGLTVKPKGFVKFLAKASEEAFYC